MFTKHLLTALIQGFTPLHMAEATEAAASTEKPRLKVKMTDGREVEFPESTKAKKTILYVKDGTVSEDDSGTPCGVRFDFVNGQTRTILASDVQALAPRYFVHGISQKHGDEYAALKDVDDCVEAFDQLFERTKKGEWKEEREGGGLAGISVLAKALVEFTKKSIDDVRTILKTLSPKEKTALRQAPGVREIVTRIEAEKAAGTKVDTSALLAKFGG